MEPRVPKAIQVASGPPGLRVRRASLALMVQTVRQALMVLPVPMEHRALPALMVQTVRQVRKELLAPLEHKA